MGQDKALLRFLGRPLIELAVEKLRSFCADVSIAGNRDDLAAYGAVVHEARQGIGPGAGLEAALLASRQPWTLLIPVDVPLFPADLLQRWVQEVVVNSGYGGSFLIANRERQPAFALLHRSCTASVVAALDAGEQRLTNLLYAADEAAICTVHPLDVKRFARNATAMEIERWFSNLNTPQEFAEAELWAAVADESE